MRPEAGRDAKSGTGAILPRRSDIDFTDAFVRGAKARGEERATYSDGATPGLELRVSVAGVKTWGYRYRDVGGRTLRLVLGAYPSMSLKDARGEALGARRLVSTGGDPQHEKQAKVAAAKAQKVRTVRDLANSYLEHAASRNRASSVAVDRQRIETHILPKLGGQLIGSLTRAQVRELVNDIGKRGQGVTANRVASILVRLYRHARTSLDMTVSNPAEGLQSTFEEASRERVLSDSELRAIWRRLEARPPSPLSEPMALCLKLCGLTLQRGNEIAGAQVEEFDLVQRLWVIPGSRTKNRREHMVPLSPEAAKVVVRAISLLAKNKKGERPRTGPLFRSPRDPQKSFTRHAVTRAMTRLCDELKIEDAGPHDLRRTGSTAITSERIGMARFVVSAVLNHVSEMGGVTRIYDRNEYLPEKRKALDAWAKVVATIARKEDRTDARGSKRGSNSG
jgi:integrase